MTKILIGNQLPLPALASGANMAQATFYTVNGPRGEYYAVRNHETKKIWTERLPSRPLNNRPLTKGWKLSRVKRSITSICWT